MKATEYVDKFHKKVEEVGFMKALSQMATAYMEEMQDLAKSRNVSTDAGIYAVIGEMDKKWRAICRLEPALDPEEFHTMLQIYIPQFYEAFTSYKRSQGNSNATKK